MGAPASASSGTAAAAAGIAGRQRATDAGGGGGGRRPGGSVCGHRRLQADCRARATRPGHGRRRGLADERGRGGVAGPVAAFVRTRDGARSRLASGGVRTALRLRTGRVSPALRPQRELGIAAVGAGGSAAGVDPTTGSTGPDTGAGGLEVSDSDSPAKHRRLSANGRHLRPAPLGHAGSRRVIHGLAQEFAGHAQTDPGFARVVFQNTAASPGERSGRSGRRVDPRSRDGGGDRESRAATYGRSRGHGSGRPATPGHPASDREPSTATPAHRRRTSGGETRTC
jgi:hypothetical protein